MSSRNSEIAEKKDWILDGVSSTEVRQTISYDKNLVTRWPQFEKDVTRDPYHHPKPKRIEKLKGEKSYPPGSWRYRNDPLRVVYLPEGSSKIIICLEAASATDIGYKKRSKK